MPAKAFSATFLTSFWKVCLACSPAPAPDSSRSKAPEHGFHAPLGDCLVFISHTPIDPRRRTFDGFDLPRYRAWLAAHQSPSGIWLPSSAWAAPGAPSPSCPALAAAAMCWLSWSAPGRRGQTVFTCRLARPLVSFVLRAHSALRAQFVGFKGFVGPRGFPFGDLA